MKNLQLAYFSLLLFLINTLDVYSQDNDVQEFNARWFVNVDLGVQMSGIKSEDFVDSNYSALQRVSFGRWLSPTIGVRVGYQGRYFNTISHERRRYYDFYFGEAFLDIRNLFSKTKKERKYKLIGHIGGGYFYNHDYDRSNIYSIIGLINSMSLTGKINLTLDVSAISGWDIYQGNRDILPGLSLGIVYLFD